MNIFKSFIISLLLFSHLPLFCVKRRKNKPKAKTMQVLPTQISFATPAVSIFNQHKMENAIVDGDEHTAEQLLRAYGSDLANMHHSHGALPSLTLANYAICRNKPEILRLLLKAGAHPRDGKGKSLLFEAIFTTRAECVQTLLVDGHADPNEIMVPSQPIQPGHIHGTPLHYNSYNLGIFGPKTKEKLKIAQALLDHGADRSIKDSNGKTAMEILDAQPEQEIAAQLKEFLLSYNPKKKIA